MKAVLNDGTEYQVNTLFMQSENVLCISFAGITSYDALTGLLTEQSLSEIKHYTSETSFDVYTGFKTVINPSTVTTAADGTLDIVVLLEKEDEVTAKLNALTERQDLTENALNELLLGGV